jgi:hypothetical protein
MTLDATAQHLPQVFWYGERGIINAIIGHLTRSGDATLSVRSLLSAVLWASGQTPEWVERINSVTIVVEVGLADFGDPDLLIVCHTSKATKLVFIEAKVVSYVDSMQSTSPSVGSRWGMTQIGFNSSINGQLSLKYRFARALSQWDGTRPAISESPAVFAGYRSRLNDSEAKAPGRTLAKPSILNRIFKPLRLHGIPEEDCCYVALTWDTASNAFYRSTEVPVDCLPVFLNEAGVDTFGDATNRVGWIGYRHLNDALGLLNSSEYITAFSTMLDCAEPLASYYAENRKGRWATFPSQIVNLASQIADEFDDRAQRWAGSYSLLDENRQTVAKIIPNDTSVFVGIRKGDPTSTRLTHWASSSGQVASRKVRNVRFDGVNILDKTQAQQFIATVKQRINSPVSQAEGDSAEPEL